MHLFRNKIYVKQIVEGTGIVSIYYCVYFWKWMHCKWLSLNTHTHSKQQTVCNVVKYSILNVILIEFRHQDSLNTSNYWLCMSMLNLNNRIWTLTLFTIQSSTNLLPPPPPPPFFNYYFLTSLRQVFLHLILWGFGTGRTVQFLFSAKPSNCVLAWKEEHFCGLTHCTL